MFISLEYTLSDRLQTGLSGGFLLLIICVSFGAIFMSVNLAERPTFEKELLALIKHLFTNVSCLFLISFISKSEFNNLIVIVPGHCLPITSYYISVQ